MKQKHVNSLLVILIIVCSIIPQRALAASNDIRISLDGIDLNLGVRPRYDNGQIMVPVKALTTALGGVSTDISVTLYTYPAVALNECGVIFATSAESYFTLPLSPEDLPFQTLEGMSFSHLTDLMTNMIFSGQIGICTITFPYEQVSGDIYLPLSTYAQLFQLSYTTYGNTVDFRRNYVEYKDPVLKKGNGDQDKRQLTFSVRLISKTYDGKPYSWDSSTLEAYCDGQKLSSLPQLRFMYWNINQADQTWSSQLPTQAGMYHLLISVDPDDPEYTGESEFAFYISEVEVELVAKDITITAGDTLPQLSFEVRRRTDGQTVTGVLRELPTLTVQGKSSASYTAGIYDIVIEGGTAADNYIITDRIGAKLTVKPIDLKKDQHRAYINGYADQTFHPGDLLTRGACAVMLSLAAEAPAGSAILFSDVPRDAWYYEAVQALAGAGVIKGYADHTFQPERPITRAEFVSMVLRLFKSEASSSSKTFLDVSTTHWAAADIQTAASQGIISGYPDGTFRPDQVVTRAEAVKILDHLTGRDTCGFTAYTAHFSDVIPGYWAYDAIMRAAIDHNHT